MDEKPTIPEAKKITGLEPHPKKTKYLTAAAIFYGNVSLGLVLTSYGPTLTSLQHKYDVDDATISRVFTVLTWSGLLGALSSGFVFNHINRQFCVIVISVVISLIMFITPHLPSLTAFFISASLLGICLSSYDTAQFVWVMEMMQKDCPPYVQSAHFFFAVGTNLGSWLMAMCLKDDNNSGNKLTLPYTIIGIAVGIGALYQIFIFTFLRYYPPSPERIDAVEETNPKENIWSFDKIRVVILCAIYYGFYQGMEICTFQFFPKFGQNSDLHLSESDSAFVLTGMSAAFAVARAVAIILVFKISTHLILGANLIMVLAANVILMMWASSSVSSLWISSVLFGLGFSSMYASFSAYMERYLRFTNSIASIMVLSGSAVIGIYPLVVGNWIERNVVVLSYTNFFSLGFIVLSVGSLTYLTSRNKTRY